MLVEIGGIRSYLSVGDRCKIQGRNCAVVRCEAVGFRFCRALAMPFASIDGVGLGNRVDVNDNPLEVYPLASSLGRVIEGFAAPLDGGPTLGRSGWLCRPEPAPAGVALTGSALVFGVASVIAASPRPS